MADNADRANDLVQWRLDLALKAHRSRPGCPSQQYCCNCRKWIPMARQIAVKGCKRCMHCQGAFERAEVRHAG